MFPRGERMQEVYCVPQYRVEKAVCFAERLENGVQASVHNERRDGERDEISPQ